MSASNSKQGRDFGLNSAKVCDSGTIFGVNQNFGGGLKIPYSVPIS